MAQEERSIRKSWSLILPFIKTLIIKFVTWVEHLHILLVLRDKNLNEPTLKCSNALWVSKGGGGGNLKLPLDKHISSTLFQVPIWQPTIINPLNRTYDSHVTSPYIIKHTGNENIQTYQVEVVYLI